MSLLDGEKARTEKARWGLEELRKTCDTVSDKMPKKDYSNWSKEELIKELKKVEKRKKYGIVWEDKPEQVALLCKEKLPVLVEDKSKEIVTDKEKPVNILIEGDNYHALSVLNYTHKGKIDVIYIDPPYNTGNGDTFRYNDKIVDKEDAYRHSKWISFMEKRLELAKNLLSRKGVIFISIGEDELASLKLLCDEIFGENNRIAILTRIAKKGSSQGKFISPGVDYVLVYAKNIDFTERFKAPINADYYSRFDKEDSTGKYLEKGLYQSSLNPMRGCSNQRYFIRCPDGTLVIPPGKVMPKTKKDAEQIEPRSKEDKVWRWTAKTYIENKNLLVFKKTKNSPLIDQNGKKSEWNVYTKQYLEKSIEKGFVPNNLIENATNAEATSELKSLNIDADFAYPKPTGLIKYLINLSFHYDKEIIVLDFFAGSGTTGHAVLDLNKEDGGNRKFILCTNNENNICTEVCYPRIKKVIQNLEKEAKGKIVKNMPGNLKYFRTDFVDANPSDKNKRKMVAKLTEMLCLKEECFDEVKEGHKFKN